MTTDAVDSRFFERMFNENKNAMYVVRVLLDEKGQPYDWIFTHGNEAMVRLGTTPKEALFGRRYSEIYEDADPKWLQPYYEAAWLGKTLEFDEYSANLKRYLHFILMPAGTPGYASAYIRDNHAEVAARMEKAQRADEMNARQQMILEALSSDYTAVYFCDLKKDYLEVVKQQIFTHSLAAEENQPPELWHSYTARFAYFKDHFLVEESCPDYWDHLGREALMNHLRKNNTHTVYGRTRANKAHKEYFEVKAVRLAETEDSFEIIVGLRPVDDQVKDAREHQRELEDLLQKTRLSNEIISAISKIYWCIYRIDLRDGMYEEISAGEEMHHLTGKYGSAMEAFAKATRDIIAEEYREYMQKFLDISTLADRLADEESITAEYRTYKGHWHQARFIAKKRDETGRVTHVLYTANLIDKTKQKELRYQAMMDTLAGDFTSAFYVDLKRDSLEVVRAMKGSHLVATAEHDAAGSFSAWCAYTADKVILPEYKEEFLAQFDPDFLKAYLKEHPMYVSRQHTWPNKNGFSSFEVRVARLHADEENFDVIIGYRPIDKIIAQEKETQEKIKAALAQAESANRAKSNFLFNMSHDIRTPMNAILGFSELLKRSSEDREKVLDYTGKIQRSGEYLLSLINNVLEIARIESGKFTLEETVIDTYGIHEGLRAIFENQMKKKGIQFTGGIDSPYRHVYADKVRIQEVLLNLISNAYKYTPAGGHIHFHVTAMPADENGISIFESVIRDDGIGMSQEFVKHIFENFSRERSSTESGQPGFGLGMAIAKSFVEIMGGTIAVESEPGKGTTFTVRIPHRVAEEDLCAAKRAAAAAKSIEGLRVLLAEDNDLNAEIAIALLEEAGVTVERAADGVECLARLEERGAGYYDLILMDIQMPNMDGYRATEIIRAMDDKGLANIPIIAMTANAFSEDKKKALAKGMNGHVAKPIDMEVVKKTIGEVLGH